MDLMHYQQKYRIVEQAGEHYRSYIYFPSSLVPIVIIARCLYVIHFYVIEHDCLNFWTKSVLYFTLSLLVLYYCNGHVVCSL
jgi:hypothetical protein